MCTCFFADLHDFGGQGASSVTIDVGRNISSVVLFNFTDSIEAPVFEVREFRKKMV